MTQSARGHGAPRADRTVLPNGLQVLTEHLDHVHSVSVGVWIAAGLAHEPPGREGINHFLEHMFFKGTRTRSALEIAEAADGLGGHVNGFTEREKMCLYARTGADRADDALELLLDLLLNSVCAEDDVRREQDVVLQEMRLVEDTPEDWVHDVLVETAWPDHPLGRQLMGTRESVRQLDGESLLAHLSDLQRAGRIIVAAAGCVDHGRVVDVLHRLTAELPHSSAPAEVAPPVFRSADVRIPRATGQAHLCVGTPGCSHTHRDRYSLSVLDAILGGGASSRLFQEIREKRGLAYNIGSYLEAFSTAGIFGISAGTDPKDLDLVLELSGREVDRLREEGPTPSELARAQTQLKVAVALAAESTSFRMQHLAVSQIHWDRVITFGEIVAGVDAVTAEEVHRLAGQAFAPGRQSVVAIGPF